MMESLLMAISPTWTTKVRHYALRENAPRVFNASINFTTAVGHYNGTQQGLIALLDETILK